MHTQFKVFCGVKYQKNVGYGTFQHVRESGTSEMSFVVRRWAWRHMTSHDAAAAADDDDDDDADCRRCWPTDWSERDTEREGRNEWPLQTTSVTSRSPWDRGNRDSLSFYLPISAAYINNTHLDVI